MNIGDIVVSTAGKDAGKYFVVVGIADGQYRFVCDGKLRKTARPKKKKIRHLKYFCSDADAQTALTLNQPVSDKFIRSVLANVKNGEE